MQTGTAGYDFGQAVAASPAAGVTKEQSVYVTGFAEGSLNDQPFAGGATCLSLIISRWNYYELDCDD